LGSQAWTKFVPFLKRIIDMYANHPDDIKRAVRPNLGLRMNCAVDWTILFKFSDFPSLPQIAVALKHATASGQREDGKPINCDFAMGFPWFLPPIQFFGDVAGSGLHAKWYEWEEWQWLETSAAGKRLRPLFRYAFEPAPVARWNLPQWSMLKNDLTRLEQTEADEALKYFFGYECVRNEELKVTGINYMMNESKKKWSPLIKVLTSRGKTRIEFAYPDLKKTLDNAKKKTRKLISQVAFLIKPPPAGAEGGSRASVRLKPGNFPVRKPVGNRKTFVPVPTASAMDAFPLSGMFIHSSLSVTSNLSSTT
jgi:hypothetical protein